MKARNIINLILICGCQLFSGLSSSLLAPFYPKEALSKGVTVTESGFVFGSVYMTLIIFTPICGKYMDKLGGSKLFLVIGSLISGLANVVFGFLYLIPDKTTFLSLSFVIRILGSLGYSGICASAYCMAVHQAGKKHEGKAMALAEACFGVGMFMGPVVGGFLYDASGFGLPFWWTGGVLALIGLALAVLDKEKKESEWTEEENVGWWSLLNVSGIPISLLAVTFSCSSWAWYGTSLEPYLESAYGTTVSQIALLFTVYGVTYTLFTPVSGFFMDKGMNGLLIQLLGNFLVTIAYPFLGPIPPFQPIGSVWLTAVSIGVQGIGMAATYLGSLVYMTQCCKRAGLPESDQVTGMVSSLWVAADCFGSYFESTLGSVAYDNIGFEWASLVEGLVIGATVLVLGGYYIWDWNNLHGKSKDRELLLQ